MINHGGRKPQTIAEVRAIVVAKLEAAQREVDRWTWFLKMFDEITGATPAPSPARITISKAASGRRLHEAVRETYDTCRIILREGRPIKSEDLVHVLAARGVVIGGPNPTAKLHARLYRCDEFQNEWNIGWSLRNPPAPAVETENGPAPGEPETGPMNRRLCTLQTLG